MNKYRDIIEKLGNKEVYMINKLRQTVLKSIPGSVTAFFIKQRGGNENSILFSTDLVVETLLKGKEITKNEYENY